MKKSLFLLVFVLLFSRIRGQMTAIPVGCGGVDVTSSIPTGAGFVTATGGFTNRKINGVTIPCQQIGLGVTTLFRTFILEKRNDQTGSFATAAESSFGAFRNLTPGVYRVRATVPVPLSGSGCLSIAVFNILEQEMGAEGTLANFGPSNLVRVGTAELSDITWDFKDDNGIQIFPGVNTLFGFGEKVKLQETNNVPYTDHFIQIQEFYPDGSPANYRAKGCAGYGCFVPGLVNISESLTDIWTLNGTSTLLFEKGRKYQVWVTISNSNCISWTGSFKEFFVCPDPLSCRENLHSIDEKVVLSPNPSTGLFSLTNLDLNNYDKKHLNLSIYDITGKEIKRFTNIDNNEFDVNELNTGIYVANLMSDGKRVYSSKFILKK
jgi:hypothetical protein